MPQAPGKGKSKRACLKVLEKKFFRVLSQGAGNCVIIQGFADRGGVDEVRGRKSPSGWIVKNIQPISVGV